MPPSSSVYKLKDSFFVWVGLTNPAMIGGMNLAMPTPFVTNDLKDTSDVPRITAPPKIALQIYIDRNDSDGFEIRPFWTNPRRFLQFWSWDYFSETAKQAR